MTNAPTGHVTLDCDRGLYSVMLGNPAAGMVAIPANLFQSYADVRLRVWFNDGTHGWQRLTPDQRIVSVGYAMFAQNAVDAQTAQSVPNGSITNEKIANNTITAQKMAFDSVTSINLANNSVTLGKIADGSVTMSKIADSSVTTAKLADSVVTSAKIAAGSISNNHIANGGIFTEDLADNSVTGAKIANAAVDTEDLANGAVTGSKVHSGTLSGVHLGVSSVEPLRIGNGIMQSLITFDRPGTTSPFAVNDPVRVDNLNSDLLDGMDSSAFIQASGTANLVLNSPAILDFGSATRQNINLWGGGSYGIGVQTNTLYQRSANSFAWFVGGSHNNNQGNPGVGGIKTMSLDNQGVLRLEAPNARIETPVLTITGGADLAETFDVTDEHLLEPGELLVIDESRPGWLKRSHEPYDTRVAGIVSGAGGVRPGLTLSQKDVMEGSHQVALTGRVYVKADDSEGAIRPGDLLTTSSRPGHASRASDHDRSHGAIIGKAMTSLEEGSGLVLVLVSLQ